MDGKSMIYRLENLLDEDSSATWLDDRTSYANLWEAAKETVRRLRNLTAKQTIVTTADTINYQLNPDFLNLLNKSKDGRYYIRYMASGTDRMLYYRDYEDIKFSNYSKSYDTHQGTMTRSATTFQDTGQDFSDWEGTAGSTALYKIHVTHSGGDTEWAYLAAASTTTNTDDTVAVYSDQAMASTGWNGTSGTPVAYSIEKVSTQTILNCFSLRDKQSLNTQVTGTATSAGAASGGKALLTDTSALFWTTDKVWPGDTAHNTTDGSDGIVLSVESTTTAYCALFGGTDNDFTSSDAYVIQPQGRVELILDPPPMNSGDIIEVTYVASPPPVYDDYGVYRFRQHVCEAIVKYAAWLYKYRDSEPDFGDKFYVAWDKAVRDESSDLNPYLKERRLRVNLKRRYGR